MQALINYLSNLNTSDSQWGLWVNPENVDEYRVGQFIFENGGLDGGWICAGSLDSLSCGFQSTHDAIKQYLEDNSDEIQYNGRMVKVNRDGIMEAYSNGTLDQQFQEFLESEAEGIKAVWAENEAEDFVYNKLPEIIEAAQSEVYA